VQSWVGESIFYTGRSRPASFLYTGQLPCFIPFFGEGIDQKSVFFAAHVNEKLRQQCPERFTALDQEYIEKVAEIDRKLLAL